MHYYNTLHTRSVIEKTCKRLQAAAVNIFILFQNRGGKNLQAFRIRQDLVP